MKLKRIVSSVLLIIILLLGISFAIINADPVLVNYYVASGSIPLSLLLVYTLGIGVVLGFLTMLGSWLTLKLENHSLKQTIKQTKHSLSNALSVTTNPQN